LCICVFLAQMESTITSTSVITITDDLGGFLKSSWILTAYWLTSGAFQIIWAKLSDIVGRKVAMMSAIAIFTIFSGACGGSQTVLQLIMFRWVQGIGGCGVLALGQLIFFDLVPPEKYTAYTTLITSVIASSLVTGPLVGGGITLHGQWRWVFLVNAPIGAVALVLLGWLLARPMWNEPAAKLSAGESISRNLLRRLDIIGTVLLLGSCLLLTTGLQQAALGYNFSSAFVLPLLICSGPFCIAFFGWQWFITTRRTQPEPVFPWRFCQNRVRFGSILISWLSGGVVSTCVFQIPQRFMTTNGFSPFDAAVRLLAFGAFVPVGSGVTGALLGRLRIRPCLIIGFGAALQLVGTALLSRNSSEYNIDPSQYAYQILIGLGLGFVMPTLIYVLPHTMEKRDLAVATAAVGQTRMLGGLIAVSIGASITTRYLTSHLAEIVPPQLLGPILERTEAIHLLQDSVAIAAREVFGKAYNLQMNLATGLAAAQLLGTALMWTRENYPQQTLIRSDSLDA
ncbi:major facilitator superfamily domain-containing protein, partial [Phaeosphaeriaceae sp. PMI808]